MNFMKYADNAIGETSKKVSDDLGDLSGLLESLETPVVRSKKSSKPSKKILVESSEDVPEISEDSSLDFVGSFSYVPNPLEHSKNALYKNLNEGKIYIRNQEGLWESFLESGKQGPQGARGPGGSGVGVQEAASIATGIVTAAIGNLVISGGSVSGNYLPLSGGTISGNLSAVNLSASDIAIAVNGAIPLGLPNSPIEAVGNVNAYFQLEMQNQSSGTNASTDFIATSDTGSDSSNYLDLGINGSQFQTTSAWSVNAANDGYLYTQGGNLSIGTSTSGKNINFFVGGTTSANVVASITPAGSLVANGTGKLQTHPLSKGCVGYKRISGNFKSFTSATSNETYLIIMSADDEFIGYSIEFPAIVGVSAVTASNLICKPVGSIAEALSYTSVSAWTYLGQPTQQPKATSTILLGSGFESVASTWNYEASVSSTSGTKPLLAILVQYALGVPRTLIQYTPGTSAHNSWRSGAKYYGPNNT